MPGYSTNGLPIGTAGSVSASSLVAVDTLNPNGSSPQSVAMPIGTLSTIQLATTAITAHAGGGQTAATQLNAGYNVVSTVVTAADSVKLPPSLPGLTVTVANTTAATSMQVFGSGIDTISGIATATGVAQAGAKTATYIADSQGTATVAANWTRVLSA